MDFRMADQKDFSQCLASAISAFEEYPFFHVYKVEDQQLLYESIMKIWMDNCFRCGTVLVAEEDSQIVGVAALKAPDDDDIDIADLSHKESETLIDLIGIDKLRSFIRMCRDSDEACNSLPDPKWYLALLAVSAEHEGKGIGSQMLQKCVLPYISAQGGGLLTFDTNTEENRVFYKNKGFEEFDEMMLVENGVKIGNWSYKKVIGE